ncbi:MAG TPA: pilus assembly PilX N-terminal domain-containing protein [Vicinamibacteria bacterium]|nr:pilus assembly PilX N-terminal domain-containing protein [Vicinamibacteria bacterium]
MERPGFTVPTGASAGRRRSDGGFALVLAILALMLLTFLGLTLAVTTSTELQIATNYRWSRQAFYNAEAGIEAGKVILANTPLWLSIVPNNRGPWAVGPPLPAPPTWPAGPPMNRDFESQSCDNLGGEGYGVVLFAAAPGGAAQRWENTSNFMGKSVNGAFTLWVRRTIQTTGITAQDDPGAPTLNTLVLTAEGVAPYIGGGTAFTKANQARQLLEMNLTLAVAGTCRQYGPQKGGAPTGENFDPCSSLAAGTAGGLAGAFGAGAGRVGGVGTLTSTGAQ